MISERLMEFAKNPLVWATLLTACVIPFLNSALTRVSTVPLFKSFVTASLAGAFAVVAWLTNLGGADLNWQAALAVFIVAAAGAGGVHAAIVKGPVADKLSRVVPINLGPVMSPEKADARHSHGAGLTEPVPADAWAELETTDIPDHYKG